MEEGKIDVREKAQEQDHHSNLDQKRERNAEEAFVKGRLMMDQTEIEDDIQATYNRNWSNPLNWNGGRMWKHPSRDDDADHLQNELDSNYCSQGGGEKKSGDNDPSAEVKDMHL